MEDSRVTLRAMVLQAGYNLPPMTVEDCFFWLEWEVEYTVLEKNISVDRAMCSCGSQLIGGATPCQQGEEKEFIFCPACHKGMQNLCGWVPDSRGKMSQIDCRKVKFPEDGATWLPVNFWGKECLKQMNEGW